MNKNNKTRIAFFILIGACICGGLCFFFLTTGVEKAGNSGHFESSTVMENDFFDTLENPSDEQVLAMIKKVYNTKKSSKVHSKISKLKRNHDYNEDNMLLIHDPYGTNNLSMYVYFKSDEAVKISYKVSVDDDTIEDYRSQTEKNYGKTHEFQIIGLVADETNFITLTMETENGEKRTKTITYKMGSTLGEEETQLSETEASEKVDSSASELGDGLYAILGNGSYDLAFTYYYDKYGNLRGEIPIINYRSQRLLFKNGLMYYSISHKKIVAVGKLGRVQQVYQTRKYSLHHDYTFDGEGNLLVLATKDGTSKTKTSVEDMVIRINLHTGRITGSFDMDTLLSAYKATCNSTTGQNVNDDMDWMHFNTIQWLENNTVILSSRETSTIFKISDIFDNPQIQYMIGESSFWKKTQYSSLLLKKKGIFSDSGGQHSVTYEKTGDTSRNKYYLYMFNNNLGFSATQPGYDWTQINGIETEDVSSMTKNQLESAYSYYYKYLVNEKTGSYRLAAKIEVPYSAYVSSVQELENSILIDSGSQGIFGEYTYDGKLIKQYKMNFKKYIYRVYKYDFDGFYNNIVNNKN